MFSICRPGLTARSLLWLCLALLRPASGETLHYRIRMGFVTAGHATLATNPWRDPGVLEIRLTARSRGLLDALYPIRDRIVSHARVGDFCTLALRRRTREGQRRLHDSWTVDPQRGEAHEANGARASVPNLVHDILSVIWRLRADAPSPGDTLRHTVFLGPGLATMTAAAGPATTAEVPAGTYACIPLYPSLSGCPRIDPDADVVMEFSRDTLRLPVRIRIRLPVVGHATAELTAVAP